MQNITDGKLVTRRECKKYVYYWS